MDIAIIPAYNPTMELVELAAELCERGIGDIIVVDDGSECQALEVFDRLGCYATVLVHDENKGKGAAIKTALKHVASGMPDVQGIVLLDADGQHRPKDAMSLLSEVHNGARGLVMGSRSFGGDIPLRSMFGNTVTKYVFRLCSGRWISDTQTGLRAFPADMIPELLQTSGERYEYEMNVLLEAAKNGTEIREIPIETIYHDKCNSCSHFRTIRDSARIYGNLLAFSGASFLSFLLDYLLFFPLVRLFGFGFAEGTALVFGNVSARMISAAFNYYLNSTFVFRRKENRLRSILSYGLLACLILTLNTVILYALHDLFGLKKALAKLITEMMLFVISFTVQRFFIFTKTKNEKKEEAGSL